MTPSTVGSHGDPNAGNLLNRGRQSGGPEGSAAFLPRSHEMHLHRSAVQHKERFRALRRQARANQWLSITYPRLILLRELLAADGSISVSIDDNERHYLKVLMDEVFGRQSFIASNVWQKRYSRESAAKQLGTFTNIYWSTPESRAFPRSARRSNVRTNGGQSTDPPYLCARVHL